MMLAAGISVDLEGRLEVGPPEALFALPGLVDYDVSADGETFYVLESVYPRRDRIDLILNFGR